MGACSQEEKRICKAYLPHMSFHLGTFLGFFFHLTSTFLSYSLTYAYLVRVYSIILEFTGTRRLAQPFSGG